MSDKIQSCFISAPFTANIEELRSALSARNIRVIGIEDFSVGGSVIEAVRKSIEKADLVIGVLTFEAHSNVMFELGFATALEKKILIFAPPKGDLHVLSALGATYIRASLKNREAIGFVLDQILASPRTPRAVHQSTKLTTPRPRLDAVTYRSQLDALTSPESERQLEMLVARALRDTGTEVVVEGPRGRGVDLVVWSDDLQPYVGNPFPIEIKRRLGSREAAKRTLSGVATAARSIGSDWSLLLYADGPASSERAFSSHPFVLTMRLDELFSELEYQSFAEVIRRLRNQRVHGGGF